MANGSNDDYTTYNEYKAGILIWKIVPPILILFGTVGNLLSIIVLTRRSIRTSTTALYLTVLACSDLLVLYSGLLRQWLRFLFEVDVRHVSEFGCKLNIWLVYCSLDFSAWILLLVTLERVVSAWLPHNAKTLCTKKSAIALLISVGVFILFLNAHLLYGMVFKYTEDENGDRYLEKCVEIDSDYSVFFNVTWPWIDLCAFCVIPFTVIVIGNGLILFKVLKSQRKVKSRVVPTVTGGGRQHTSNHSSKQSSMTAMLFTLNVVFLFSTSPVSIYNVGYTYWEKGATEHDWAQLDMWWAVVNMLMYVNNSFNFLLYCLSGSRFRQEVIRLFTSWRQRANGSNLQLAHSNYSRTKFDMPSASPSQRHSLSKTNDETPVTNINGLHNGLGDQNGETHFGHSNNSLHPDDALRPMNKLSSFKDNGDEKGERTQSDNVEVSETIGLDNLDGCIMVKSTNDISVESDNGNNLENKPNTNRSPPDIVETDASIRTDTIEHADDKVNGTEKQDGESLNPQSTDIRADVKNIDTHENVMNTETKDSTV